MTEDIKQKNEIVSSTGGNKSNTKNFDNLINIIKHLDKHNYNLD